MDSSNIREEETVVLIELQLGELGEEGLGFAGIVADLEDSQLICLVDHLALLGFELGLALSSTLDRNLMVYRARLNCLSSIDERGEQRALAGAGEAKRNHDIGILEVVQLAKRLLQALLKVS